MTAVVIAAAIVVVALTATSATSAPPNNPVVIANGWSPSDVGTAAPLAGSIGGSVLYAERNGQSLGAPTVAALRQLRPSKVILVGGTNALGNAIVDEVREVTGLEAGKVERLAGSNRIDTAAKGALYTLDGSSQPTTSEAPQADTDCPANPFVLGVSGGWERVDLRCANFANATMTYDDEERWRFIGRDLRGANFSGTYFHGVDFTGADLRGANLARIGQANRWDYPNREYPRDASVHLIGADLRGADLTGATLRGVDLRGADLRGANLFGTYFTGADLSNADLRDATGINPDDEFGRWADIKTEGCRGCP